MKSTILVIEDDKDYQAVIREFLHEDYALIYASTFKEGIEAASAQRFDAVLLDLSLPDTSIPQETLKQFFRHHPSLAVLVVTNHANENMMQVSFEYGSYGYLVKSQINKDWLISAIFAAIYHKNIQARHQERLDALNRKIIAMWQPLALKISQVISRIDGLQSLTSEFEAARDDISKQFAQLQEALYPKPNIDEIKKLTKSIR